MVKTTNSSQQQVSGCLGLTTYFGLREGKVQWLAGGGGLSKCEVNLSPAVIRQHLTNGPSLTPILDWSSGQMTTSIARVSPTVHDSSTRRGIVQGDSSPFYA
ncbi:hypothetical protein RRG08_014056 [Elysia crispata]|uniref:Uncharacterized protein n=1 Tax=Elysia crispata TaxID=231223 RepID=A0AAE0ZZF0_9GAST|nr:hypothetical protein RRG08_014056 [Elysia crispata]